MQTLSFIVLKRVTDIFRDLALEGALDSLKILVGLAFWDEYMYHCLIAIINNHFAK